MKEKEKENKINDLVSRQKQICKKYGANYIETKRKTNKSYSKPLE